MRIALLWGLISVHVVGGAILFRRLFPRESPWFGFVVPGLALALVLNFIEHGVYLPALRWLMPFTTLGFLWLIISRKTSWRFFWVPTVVFLFCFSLTLFLKCLKPDISTTRDGINDLSLIANFCMGQPLPVDSTWVPPVKFTSYYAFGHYAAAVLTRLFGLDTGSGYNLSAALVCAFIYFLTAATAWRLGRHRWWIMLLALFLILCATTGSTGYLWLTEKDTVDPADTANLLNRTDDPHSHIAFEGLVKRIYNWYSTRELIVPGYWSWMGGYHSATEGQFLTLLAVYSLVELLRRCRCDWPWIGLFGSAMLMLVCCTWGLPFVGILFLCGLAWCAYRRITPRDWRFVVLGWAAITVCLTPMLLYFLRMLPPWSQYLNGEENTQLAEFVIQWWPIYVPWFALLFYWRKLPPAVLIIHLLVPVALYAMEFYSVAARLDMTGKIWGFIYGAAWAVFIPTLAIQRSWLLRGVLVLLVAYSGLSLWYWISYEHRTFDPNNAGQLEGTGQIRYDAKKNRVLNVIATMKHQLIIPGQVGWSFTQSAEIGNITLNYNYAAWSFACDVDLYPNGFGEGERRANEVNAIYSGKNPNPLPYLKERHIAAFVIWPDDNTPDDLLAKLKVNLAPAYRYEDCREGEPPNPPNAGVFISRELH